MGNRQQIQAIPGALRVTLEKARGEYETAIRRIRWGDGPIYVCGTGSCAALGRAAGYAIEAFLGLPVVARPAEVLQHYTPSLLRPRPVLLMISAAGECAEAEELVRVVRRRASTLVLLTNTPDSPLAKLADQVLLVRAEGDGDVPAVIICLHAALNFLALAAARVLKRPEPQWDSLAGEFEELPAQIDWVHTQLPVAVRAMAEELRRFPHLQIVGGGFYHFPAWHAARRLRALAGLRAEGMEAAEFSSELAGLVRSDAAVLFLSGSRSKIKQLAPRSAARVRGIGARVLSITDSNDRDLAEQSDLGLLIPASTEAAGCTLSLFLAEWLAAEAARVGKQPPVSSRGPAGEVPPGKSPKAQEAERQEG
jgi:glucosamine--fructose-6-phosphate aminotransferase (isomerizing)